MINETLKESNLIGLHIDTPYNFITRFINKYKESKTTQITYQRHFSYMFQFMCNKSVNELSWEDVNSITLEKVLNYRDVLTQQYKNSTINSRIFACKALWDDLLEQKKVDRSEGNIFDIKPLKQHDNCYDALTSDEFNQLLEYAQIRYKGNTQRLYFYFLYRTLLRKHIAQELTWEQIVRKQDRRLKKSIWVIKVNDKGTIREVAITDNFYDELKENWKTYNNTNNHVFQIDNKTIDKTLKDFCKEYKIDRNIVQHSIKSTGGDIVQEVYGDIHKTAKALGHKNIQTTYNNYISKNQSYSSQPSYELDQKYNIELFRGLGEDVLLKLIESAGDRVIQALGIELDKMSK